MRGIGRITVWIGVSVLLAGACVEREDVPPVAKLTPEAWPAGVTAAELAEGRRVFLDLGNCFACHGRDAQGTVFGPDLADTVWMHINGSYEEIARVVAGGIPHTEEYPSPMPAMGGARLTADEVKAVAAYIYVLSHGA